MRMRFLLGLAVVFGCARDVTEPVIDQPEFVLIEPGTVAQVSVGGGHSCALRTDGTVACWGLDGSGQATPPAATFTQVSAGGAHTCGLKPDGSIACWGANGSAQASPPGGTFTQVSAGGLHTCGLRTDGTVGCWGDNRYAQATPPADAFTQLSAGGWHTCGLKADGTIACWGSDFSGETRPPSGTAFSQVSAGKYHTCGVKTDSTLACWGDDGWGGFGAATPPPGAFRQVSAGNGHTCGVKTDDTLACWGRNGASPPTGTFTQVSAWGEDFHLYYGERGHACGVTTDGSVVCWGYNRYEPPPTATFTALDAGASHTCALNPDDTVTCWGAGSLWGMASAPVGTFRQVSAGNDHNCGVKTDGTLACWGINATSPPAGTFTQVSAGGDTRIPENEGERGHACAVRTDGTVVCWGYNQYGQAPPLVGSTVFTQVSAGLSHTCGLKADGTVACWGANTAGQASPPAGTFTQVSAGDLHSCALKTDGTVACWGDNSQGQAKPGAAFTQVSAGGLHSCGLKTDGTIACWGDNRYGQATAPAGTFTEVSAGKNFTCALEAGDASVACWGEEAIAETPNSPVTASAYQSPNGPENTLDNDLSTRWSAEGDGQWIQYDLGAPMDIGRVDIAWYNGTQWESAFEIQVSQDGTTWTPVFAGRSSGTTLEAEGYAFSTVTARYVRIIGHGQWNGTTLSSWWTSITEVDIANILPVATVVASTYQSPNVPENTVDNQLGTRWSAQGDGQWIQYDLGAPTAVRGVDIAWYNGNLWESAFAIAVSADGFNWVTIFDGRSSGQSTQFERYDVSPVACRYVRVIGHGQWNGSTLSSWWNSLTEVDLRPGSAASACPEPPHDPTTTLVSGGSAIGSGLPLPGKDRVEGIFDVTNSPSGTFVVRDYSAVRSNGTVASLTVDATLDPETGIRSFTRTSAACAAFSGIGRVDTGELVTFTVDACDNGIPGMGTDVFALNVPAFNYQKSGTLSAGEITLSSL